MASEQLMPEGGSGSGSRYAQMQSEHSNMSSFFSLQNPPEASRIFDELPQATIVQVSRNEAGDISPMLLTYTIDFQYKQFKWQLVKKGSHVFYLHFALKKRAIIEEIHEKQEQVREWLQNLGIMDHHAVVHGDDEEPDDDVTPVTIDESVRNRDVPSRAALPMIRPKISTNDDNRMCSACHLFNCCNDNWQQVWAVLKPGFLALYGIGPNIYRESEPNSWEDTMKDELNREKYPRMPWHDVHCALWGPPCRDIARHFVQRWNYAKRNKAPNEQTIPLLMPQQHMVIPHYMGSGREQDEDGSNTGIMNSTQPINRQDSFSSLAAFQDIPLLIPQEADNLDDSPSSSSGHTRQINSKPYNNNNNNNNHGQASRPPRAPFSFRKSKIDPLVMDMPMRGFVDDQGRTSVTAVQPHPPMKSHDREWWESQERGNLVVSTDESGQVGPRVTCKCQVIRSVSLWSAGTSQVEGSIHNAYCSLIEKAEHLVYIENQFFISGLSGDEIIRNRVLDSLYKRILRAHQEKQCFRAIIVIPLLPGFQGGLDDGGAASVRAIMHWQYRTISRGPNSILHNLSDRLGPIVDDYISFYGLRAYGRLATDGLVVTPPTKDLRKSRGVQLIIVYCVERKTRLLLIESST